MDKSLIQETLDILRFAAGPLLRTRQPREASDAGSAGRKSIGDAADSFLLEVSKVWQSTPSAVNRAAWPVRR